MRISSVRFSSQLLFFGLLDRQESLTSLSGPLAGEDLDVNDRALDARRAGKRRVSHVSRLLAEDGTKEFLFGCQLSLTLRRNLAYKDRSRLDLCADTDDSALVEIAQSRPRRRSEYRE